MFCTLSSCILVKRIALIRIGLLNKNLKFWQDYELEIRLIQKSPFYYVPKDLVVYQIDNTNINRLTNKFFEWRSIVKQIHSYHCGLYKKLALKKILVKDILL